MVARARSGAPCAKRKVGLGCSSPIFPSPPLPLARLEVSPPPSDQGGKAPLTWQYPIPRECRGIACCHSDSRRAESSGLQIGMSPRHTSQPASTDRMHPVSPCNPVRPPAFRSLLGPSSDYRLCCRSLTESEFWPSSIGNRARSSCMTSGRALRRGDESIEVDRPAIGTKAIRSSPYRTSPSRHLQSTFVEGGRGKSSDVIRVGCAAICMKCARAGILLRPLQCYREKDVRLLS